MINATIAHLINRSLNAKQAMAEAYLENGSPFDKKTQQALTEAYLENEGPFDISTVKALDEAYRESKLPFDKNIHQALAEALQDNEASLDKNAQEALTETLRENELPFDKNAQQALAEAYIESKNQFEKSARQALAEAFSVKDAELVESRMYIGLNDAESKTQEHATIRYIARLKELCIEHETPFSFDVVEGGYIHDNGEYTEEKTIVLTFIDIPQETVDAIAKDLCTEFNQESVLITTGNINARSIRAVQ